MKYNNPVIVILEDDGNKENSSRGLCTGGYQTTTFICGFYCTSVMFYNGPCGYPYCAVGYCTKNTGYKK